MAEVINTIGRRKTAVARVYMTTGNGEIKVNGRDYKEYFPTGPLQYIVNQAFAATSTVAASPARPRPCVWPSPAPSARTTSRIAPP